MKRTRFDEKGQILVIFIFVLIGLLGFTALAIDGGMIYADRRYDQAAADASSLAGAGAAAQLLEEKGVDWNQFSCTSFHGQQAQTFAVSAAKNRAATNNFSTLDNDLTDKHGIVVTCTNNPAKFDKRIEVRTQLSSDVSTAFAHLMFSGPIKNTVDAVVRIRPRTNVGFGYAIASLGSVCATNDGGVVFSGSTLVNIKGGGVFSNSCIEADGGIDVAVENGKIEYMTTYVSDGSTTVTPAPTQAAYSMPVVDIDPPACSTDAPISHTGGGTISPGNYSQIRLTAPSQILTMNPGVYCLTGDFTVNNGTVNGDGVTIYMKKNGSSSTSFDIAGNATVNLSAPVRVDGAGNQHVGMLLYMDPTNDGVITLAGTSTSMYKGTIYAPKGEINAVGNQNMQPNFHTQLIGEFVKIVGNAEINIEYNDFEPASDPPRLDVLE